MLTKHRDLLPPSTDLKNRTFNLDFADADVREFPLLQEVRTTNASLRESALKVVRVALIDRDDGSTRLVGSVWKNETRRLPGFEPNAEFKPLRLFIGHRRLREERLDRLGIMDVVLGRVAGNDTE